MVQKQEGLKTKSGVVTLVEGVETETEKIEKKISEKVVLEFISRHHLHSLWDAFLYEKSHPKNPLSASDVLAMINLSPEEQEKILKEHE